VRALLLGLAALSAGCAVLQPVDPEDPCLEAGYAIAWITEVCSQSVELGNARYEQFDAEYQCVGRAFDDPELEAAGIRVEDLYDCSFAIRQLPCEVVDDYGTDLASYLAVSEACTWIVEPARGGGE
jgi:hypothetical protein